MADLSVRAVSGVLVLLGLAGCGGESAPAQAAAGAGGSTAGSGGAGGGAGASSGGSGSSAGGSSAGAGAGAGSAGAGSGGVTAALPCDGVYKQAFPALLEDMNISMNGVTLTADEQELYYSRQDSSTLDAPQQVVRRRRAQMSGTFGELEMLPELASACEPMQRANPDISEDGLTLYVTCTPMVEIGVSEGQSLLRVAHRPDRSAPFVLDPEPIGSVHGATGISADELTAYADGEVFDTAPSMFRRESKTAPFGPAEAVPGISTPFRSPDVSADGLALFGAAAAPDGVTSALYRALRSSADAPFAAPEWLDLQLSQVPMVDGVGAPNVTPRCAVYYIAVFQARYALAVVLPEP